jgi:hypothetical protein
MKDGNPWIILASEYQRKAQVIAKISLTDDFPSSIQDKSTNTVHIDLRLTIKKDVLIAEIRNYEDSSTTEWKYVGEIDSTTFPPLMDVVGRSKLCAGVLVNGGVEASKRTSHFKNFTFSS